MKWEDCFNHLLWIQNRYPVETWTIGDVQVWPIIRVNIMFQVRALTTTTATIQPQQQNVHLSTGNRWLSRLRAVWSWGKRWLSPLRVVWNWGTRWLSRLRTGWSWGKLIFKYNFYRYLDRKHNDTLNRKVDILCLTFSHYRATKINGYYYLRNLQSFLDLFPDASTCIMELIGLDRSALRPRYGKSVYIEDLMLADKIKQQWDFSSFKKRPSKNLIHHLPYWDEVISYLQSNGCPIVSLHNLEVDIESLIEKKNFFSKQLRNIAPKLVVMEYYYNLISEALVLACKELHIPCADLQHGTQHAWHPAYSSLKPTATGYNIIPQYFFVWTDLEKQSIQRWNYMCPIKHIPFVIGNLWEELWDGEDLPSIFQLYVNPLNCLQKAKNTKVNILFALNHELPDERIFDIINQSPEDWCWWIRLHPVNYVKWDIIKKYFVERLIHQNINLNEATEWPLPALLRFIDLNITRGSTVALECASKLIPSIIMESSWLNGYEQYSSWIDIIPIDSLTVENIQEVINTKKRKTQQIKKINHPDLELVRKLVRGEQ